MLIGSLVELHVGLHSCLCFSHLENLFLKVGSTPLWYLLDSSLSVKLPKLFLFVISPAPRYLVDQSSFYSWFLLSCSSIPPRHLSSQRAFFSTPPRQIPWYLSIPASVEIYYELYISPLCDLELISLSLSRYFSVFSPRHSHLTPNFVLQGFFKLFQEFLSLVSF